jgi:hypothetical protein
MLLFIAAFTLSLLSNKKKTDLQASKNWNLWSKDSGWYHTSRESLKSWSTEITIKKPKHYWMSENSLFERLERISNSMPSGWSRWLEKNDVPNVEVRK